MRTNYAKVALMGAMAAGIAINSCKEDSKDKENSTTAPQQAVVTGNAANTCPTASVTLTANAQGATSYKWYNGNDLINGEKASTYTAAASGTYYAAGVNADGDGAKSTGKAVTISSCSVVPWLAVITGDAANVCPVIDSVILTANAQGATSYRWYKGNDLINGATTNTYTVFANGTYYAEGINAIGAGTKSDGKTVTIIPCPLQEGFSVPAAKIGSYTPAADGISGTITNTGGSNYKVRSMGGTWWMIQNADKPVGSSDCTYPSIARTNAPAIGNSVAGNYGHLYSWSCAGTACPPGWSLPNDADFTALSTWLTANNKWSEWNSGFALAGIGERGRYDDYQGSYGFWWSREGSRWYSGGFIIGFIESSLSVRCRKSQ